MFSVGKGTWRAVRHGVMVFAAGSLLVACGGVGIDRAAPDIVVSGTIAHSGIQDEVSIGGVLIQSGAVRAGD